MYPLLKADGEEEQTRIAQEMQKAIETHVEPLLKDAKPFFGGSSEFTMAEVRDRLILSWRNVLM